MSVVGAWIFVLVWTIIFPVLMLTSDIWEDTRFGRFLGRVFQELAQFLSLLGGGIRDFVTGRNR
jgi:hypothetical protein